MHGTTMKSIVDCFKRKPISQ